MAEEAESQETAKELEFKITESTMEFTYQNQQFTFEIPTPRQAALIGVRARKLRLEDDPTSTGDEEGLGMETMLLYRAMATFEVLLKRTSDRRLMTPDKDGKPVCDSSKWDRTISFDYIWGVYEGYLKALDSFRSGVDRSKPVS